LAIQSKTRQTKSQGGLEVRHNQLSLQACSNFLKLDCSLPNRSHRLSLISQVSGESHRKQLGCEIGFPSVYRGSRYVFCRRATYFSTHAGTAFFILSWHSGSSVCPAVAATKPRGLLCKPEYTRVEHPPTIEKARPAQQPRRPANLCSIAAVFVAHYDHICVFWHSNTCSTAGEQSTSTCGLRSI
jgi:hypothetical protein